MPKEDDMTVMPVEKDFYVTSGFGPRGAEHHWGVDFGAPGGSGGRPVYAVKDGTVTRAGPASGFGQWVTIDHPASNGGGETVYGHVIPEVRVGQAVREGQRIARINPDSNTNGGVAPHLHLEWHKYSWVPPGPNRLNPMTMLKGAAWPGETRKTKQETRGTMGQVKDWTSRFGFGQPRNTSLIRAICIHVTVNTPGTPAENVANYQIRSESGSYHELVDTGANVLIENTDDWLSWSAGPKGNWCALHRSFVMRGTESQAEWRKYDAMLRAGAQRDAQWAKKYNIPVVKLTPAELRAGKRGFCGHHDVSLAWGESDHVDPGAGFPWDYYLQLVREHMNPAPAKKNEGGFSVDAERKIDLILDQLVGWEKDANGPKFTGWKPGDIRKSIAAKKANGSGLTVVEQLQDVSDRLSAVEAKIKGDK